LFVFSFFISLIFYLSIIFAILSPRCLLFFFFNHPASSEFYTLSLHDALPIWLDRYRALGVRLLHTYANSDNPNRSPHRARGDSRSEEHTSELQSRFDLVCRLLLEKKK